MSSPRRAPHCGARKCSYNSAPFGSMENLAHAGCRYAFTAAGPPNSGLPLRPQVVLPPASPPLRKQAHRLLRPSGRLSGFRGASGGQQSYPTLLCGAPAAAGSEASEGPAPGHQGAARAPHSPASSGAAGVLPGRTARHPNPEPSYSPRERLRPRPTAPTRTAFRSLQQPPPPSPLHKMAADPLRRSAFQKGRGWVVTSRARRRKRTDVFGLSPGSCPGVWRKEL